MNQLDELRPVIGFEGLYSVTRDGRVWSHPKAPQPGKQGRKHEGQWRATYMVRTSRTVQLSRSGEKVARSVRVLVNRAWSEA